MEKIKIEVNTTKINKIATTIAFSLSFLIPISFITFPLFMILCEKGEIKTDTILINPYYRAIGSNGEYSYISNNTFEYRARYETIFGSDITMYNRQSKLIHLDETYDMSLIYNKAFEEDLNFFIIPTIALWIIIVFFFNFKLVDKKNTPANIHKIENDNILTPHEEGKRKDLGQESEITKAQAIEKLKESKELLDLEIITQEDYDKVKEEMTKFIK